MCPTIMLTEPEVAERLGCSTTRVKRLRLSGRLAYIPDRPLLVDETDLVAFLERSKTEKQERVTASRAFDEQRMWMRLKLTGPRPPPHSARAPGAPELRRTRPGAKWYIHWTEDRRSKRVSTRTSDISAAQSRFREWLQKRHGLLRTEEPSGAPARPHGRPQLKKARNGVWYVHWTEGRRSRRLTTKARELAAAERFLANWLALGPA